MRNFKDIILEKLKVSSKSASSFDDIFDDIMPCDFSEELFIDTAHILHKRAYTNVHEYYDLKNIYGVFLGNKSKYQGIIEIWNIDSFEAGNRSKTSLLNEISK